MPIFPANDIVRQLLRRQTEATPRSSGDYKKLIAPFFIGGDAKRQAGLMDDFNGRLKQPGSAIFAVLHGFTVLDLSKSDKISFEMELDGRKVSLTISFAELLSHPWNARSRTSLMKG